MRSIVNIALFLGLLLSTYFLYLSTTPEGYTGIFIFFQYTVSNPIAPLAGMVIFSLALIIFNWKIITTSAFKLRFIGLASLGILIIVTVFVFMTYKRHNRFPWEKRNVLVIVVDTLRADHVSAYNREYAETPNIDSLATDGWLFERAYTHIPITLPSHSSLFTGRLPSEVNVYNNRDDFQYQEQTLAEIFKANGYKTMGAISLGVLKARFNINRGFDTYLDDLPKDGRWYNRADVITDRGINWLKENVSGGDDRFFMFLHYQDPHEPYNPPGEQNDIAINFNGEEAGEGNIDSAAWVEVPITIQPGENRLTIKRQIDDEKYRPYFLKMAFSGDAIKDGPFPEHWQDRVNDAIASGKNHRINKMLEDLQTDAFLTNFEGLAFAGLEFAEGGGFSPPEDASARPRRYLDADGTMIIRNTTDEPVELTFRVKGGANKSPTRVWEDYSKEVVYNDQQIGRLLNYLRSKGLMDNTIIVFMSDHGEELNEHGRIGHIHNLYTESIHVPLIIRDPNTSFKGKRVNKISRIQDIAPTLLDMNGIAIPEYMTGKTLIEYIQRNRGPVRQHFAETHSPEADEDKYAIVEEKSISIYNPNAEAVRQLEYYNLESDPLQWQNLAMSGESTGNLTDNAIVLKNSSQVIEDQKQTTELKRQVSASREEMLADLGYLTSGGQQASFDFIGIPDDQVLRDVETGTRQFADALDISAIEVKRAFIGNDPETGYYYIHLSMQVPDDVGAHWLMAVQGNIHQLARANAARQFPLRYTLSDSSGIVMDQVYPGSIERIVSLYTLRMMRMISHAPYGVRLSPGMEVLYDHANRILAEDTGAEPY